MRRRTTEESDSTRITSRRTLLKTVGIGTGATLAGCMGNGGGSGDSGSGGSSGGGGNGGTNIRYLLESPGQGVEQALDSIASRYNEETGNTVEFLYTPSGAGVGERLSQMVSGGNPPDLVQSTQSDLARFYAQDIARPISDLYNEIADRYSDVNRRNRFEVEGEEYMVPLYHQRGINWHRQDIWDTVPTTWEEEITQVEKFNDTNDLQGYFLGVSGSDICVQYQVLNFLYQNGGRTFGKENDEIVPIMTKGSNRSKWVEALEHMDQLHEYAPEGADAGCSQMSQAIASEVATGQWYVGFRPPLQADDQDRPFAQDVKPYAPTAESGMNLDAKLFGSSIGLISPRGANEQAARDFTNFLYKPENITEYLMGVPIHNIPPFPEIIDSDSYQSELDTLVSESAYTMETVNRYFDVMDDGIAPLTEVEPFNPYGGLIVSLGHLGQGLVELLLEDADPEEAVETIQQLTMESVEEAKGN